MKGNAMMKAWKQCAMIATAGAAVSAAPAMGASELQLDVNALTTDIAAAAADSMDGTRGAMFGTDFSGTLTMSDDGNSSLTGILIDGASQAVSGTLQGFSGQISLNDGDVAGGSFTITVLESDGVTTNNYEAEIASGSGSVNTQAGEGFTIDGLTFNGMFTSDTFAGVDVSPWFDFQPLRGSFLEFSLNPGAEPRDFDTDIDVFVATIPLPMSGGLAAAGLIGLACVRRR